MTSKFGPILKEAKGRAAAVEPPHEPTPAQASAATPSASINPPAPLESPRRGRPPGKRSDPGFVQVSAYIADDLYHSVKLSLLKESKGRKGREFSELVSELLSGWLDTRPGD